MKATTSAIIAYVHIEYVEFVVFCFFDDGFPENDDDDDDDDGNEEEEEATDDDDDDDDDDKVRSSECLRYC